MILLILLKVVSSDLNSAEGRNEKDILTVLDGRDQVVHFVVFVKEANVAAPIDDGGRVARLTLGHKHLFFANLPADDRIETGDRSQRFVARVERQERAGAHRQAHVVRLEAERPE